MNISRSNFNPKNVAFSGHKTTLDKTGSKVHKFYYLYDTDKYSCQVELFNIKKGDDGQYVIGDKITGAELNGGAADIDLWDYKDKVTSDIGFAYRFKLTDKDGNSSYAVDNGTVQGLFDTKEGDGYNKNKETRYNVILNNRAVINKNGAMQLIMPDGYYPGVEKGEISAADSLKAQTLYTPKLNPAKREKANNAVRHHGNKLGGNFFGIIERLPDLEKEGVKRIVGTPYTKDSISSHKYWTENAFRVAPDFGSEEDFKQLQIELFKHGINWISDAALVNEGLGGVHVSEYFRKGDSSYAKDMFRTFGKPALGVIPEGGKEFTRIKLINSPFVIGADGKYSKNPDYKAIKPTYVQFYDERLASEGQKTSQEIIATYDNKNTDNMFDITNHDDVVYPYHFEVDPKELERNIKNVQTNFGNIDLGNIEQVKKLVDFSTFSIVEKAQSGGIEVWDGNVDIPKINFYMSKSDEARFNAIEPEFREKAKENAEKGAMAVRDYALTSGQYWTKFAADTQLQYVSSLLASKGHDYNKILNGTIEELPLSASEVIDTEIIDNVLGDNYISHRLDLSDIRKDTGDNVYSGLDYIKKKAMDVPLETIPVANNLLGILTSPYIAKKPNTEEEIGVSRFDLYKGGNKNLPEKYAYVYTQMDDVYGQIAEKIGAILKDVKAAGKEGEGIEESEQYTVTDFGKFVENEVTPDLTKYLILKALNPDAAVKVSDNGEFDFSEVNEDEITIQSLGIPYKGLTEEEEAQIVVSKLSKGLNNIKTEEIQNLKGKMQARFADRTTNDFKVAEMILDRTESGIGWRIDAAKDIVSIDDVRSGKDTMANVWNKVIDFWKNYNQKVLGENPHAYTTAEITDLDTLFLGKKEDGTPDWNGNPDARMERKFLEETGITCVANYSYFFSLPPALFVNGAEENEELRNKLSSGWCGARNPGFLFQSPADGLINSYTFVDNHDKPRIINLLSMNQDLYTTDFNDNKSRTIAQNVLSPVIDAKNIDFDKINSKAIAMGDRLLDAFEEIGLVTYDESDEFNNEIRMAVAQLALGSFKGKDFDADAFGTRPFDIAIKAVFDQIEYNGGKVENRKELESKTLKSILDSAYDRYYSIYKLLTVLPGSPTDFAGDRVGASGYETGSKNYHQQNRNTIHWEWLKDKNPDGTDNVDNHYSFIKGYYDKINEIAALRNNPNLSALNDGDTISLSNAGDNKKIQAFIRYNDKSTVLVVTDTSGASSPLTEKMNRKNTSVKVCLNPDGGNT
ncbi:hypothetical protein II906_05540, partial [bacterium]|nr:hypothetical protein [bacterium]